jgi:hypothetical protein
VRAAAVAANNVDKEAAAAGAERASETAGSVDDDDFSLRRTYYQSAHQILEPVASQPDMLVGGELKK